MEDGSEQQLDQPQLAKYAAASVAALIAMQVDHPKSQRRFLKAVRCFSDTIAKPKIEEKIEGSTFEIPDTGAASIVDHMIYALLSAFNIHDNATAAAQQLAAKKIETLSENIGDGQICLVAETKRNKGKLLDAEDEDFASHAQLNNIVLANFQVALQSAIALQQLQTYQQQCNQQSAALTTAKTKVAQLDPGDDANDQALQHSVLAAIDRAAGIIDTTQREIAAILACYQPEMSIASRDALPTDHLKPERCAALQQRIVTTINTLQPFLVRYNYMLLRHNITTKIGQLEAVQERPIAISTTLTDHVNVVSFRKCIAEATIIQNHIDLLTTLVQRMQTMEQRLAGRGFDTLHAAALQKLYYKKYADTMRDLIEQPEIKNEPALYQAIAALLYSIITFPFTLIKIATFKENEKCYQCRFHSSWTVAREYDPMAEIDLLPDLQQLEYEAAREPETVSITCAA